MRQAKSKGGTRENHASARGFHAWFGVSRLGGGCFPRKLAILCVETHINRLARAVLKENRLSKKTELEFALNCFMNEHDESEMVAPPVVSAPASLATGSVPTPGCAPDSFYCHPSRFCQRRCLYRTSFHTPGRLEVLRNNAAGRLFSCPGNCSSHNFSGADGTSCSYLLPPYWRSCPAPAIMSPNSSIRGNRFGGGDGEFPAVRDSEQELRRRGIAGRILNGQRHNPLAS